VGQFSLALFFFTLKRNETAALTPFYSDAALFFCKRVNTFSQNVLNLSEKVKKESLYLKMRKS
jgi:hypothetical protein